MEIEKHLMTIYASRSSLGLQKMFLYGKFEDSISYGSSLSIKIGHGLICVALSVDFQIVNHVIMKQVVHYGLQVSYNS